jgi:glycosyltransferase involved in cell wall biosynthesis
MKNDSKKKVAIFYSGGRYFGGIEQYLVDLFDNVNKNKIELELLSMGEWPLTNRLLKNRHKVTFLSQKRISAKTIKLAGDYLISNDFDLLVSQGVVANAYARSISLFYKIPNLVTVHSVMGGDYSSLLGRTVYKIIDKLTRFSTDSYIAVSEYLKSEMLKSGILKDKILVIYNGIKIRSSKPINNNMKIIGSVGRLHPTKGYDLLIQAFAKLDDKKVLLKIAGEGPELNRLVNLAVELGVADRVEFVGFKKYIYEFLDSVDIYVQSSLTEGFGLSVVEAMSQGLPVVVTPAGSLKEIVKNRKTGIITKDLWPENIAAAIDDLLKDKDLANKISKNAKEFVDNNFSMEKWVNMTTEAYKKAAK